MSFADGFNAVTNGFLRGAQLASYADALTKSKDIDETSASAIKERSEHCGKHAHAICGKDRYKNYFGYFTKHFFGRYSRSLICSLAAQKEQGDSYFDQRPKKFSHYYYPPQARGRRFQATYRP